MPGGSEEGGDCHRATWNDQPGPGPPFGTMSAVGAQGGGWTEVRVDVPIGWHELVAETLTFGPCTTVAIGPTSVAAPQPADDREAVRTFIRADQDTQTLRDQVRERLRDLAERSGDPALSGLSPSFKPLPPEDYATSWRKSSRPFRVGRLVLVPPWEDSPRMRDGDVRLTIEPGGSFGSGRHATTRTCLRVIDERIRGGERVLDAGAGSGILSVAASLLGAREAFGFDLDPASHPSATALANDNGVGDLCTFREGDFAELDRVDGSFDVVLANIYADVLMTYCWDLRQRMTPDAWFCFSGCRIDHVDATREALLASELVVDEERLRGRWMTFVGRPAAV